MKKTKTTSDPVNHPSHYTSHPSGVECITVVEHMPFNVGNAVKYLWRVDQKDDEIEDLKKARWYVDREIQRREVEKSITGFDDVDTVLDDVVDPIDRLRFVVEEFNAGRIPFGSMHDEVGLTLREARFMGTIETGKRFEFAAARKVLGTRRAEVLARKLLKRDRSFVVGYWKRTSRR